MGVKAANTLYAKILIVSRSSLLKTSSEFRFVQSCFMEQGGCFSCVPSCSQNGNVRQKRIAKPGFQNYRQTHNESLDGTVYPAYTMGDNSLMTLGKVCEELFDCSLTLMFISSSAYKDTITLHSLVTTVPQKHLNGRLPELFQQILSRLISLQVARCKRFGGHLALMENSWRQPP